MLKPCVPIASSSRELLKNSAVRKQVSRDDHFSRASHLSEQRQIAANDAWPPFEGVKIAMFPLGWIMSGSLEIPPSLHRKSM